MFELFIVIITLFTVASSIFHLLSLVAFHVKIKQLSNEIYECENLFHRSMNIVDQLADEKRHKT